MPTVSELTVVINVDDKELTSGLSKAEKQVSGFGDSLGKGLGMGLGFGAIGVAIGAVSAGVGALKGSVIDLNGSLEQSQIAFTTMLGSAEAAETFLGDLQKFAAQTPFEFPDLVSASKRMLAFGFESKQVVPLLTAVGDAVAAVGGGAEVIDGVTTAIGQMQAKGKVSAEEMGQLAERGIPAWDMLAKKLGVSVAEAMDMVSKGQVKAATFVEAFQEGAAERFGGMMEKQSQTWSGALSTISDSLNMASAKAFAPFFKLISEGAIALSKFVQSEQFNAWAQAAATAIDGLVSALRGMFDILRGGTGSIERVRELLTTLFPPEVAHAIIGAITDLGDLFTQVFSGNIAGALDAVKRTLGNFAEIIGGLVEEWASAFAGWVDGAATSLIDNLGSMSLDLQDWILDAALTLVEKLAQWGAAFVDWIGPKIPDILRELGAYLVKLTTWVITDALPTIVTKLAQWGAAFVEWIGPKIVPMLYELGKLEVELLTWLITTALPGIVGKLGEWGKAFVDWVAPLIPPLLIELAKVLLQINTWIVTTALPGIAGKLLEWAGAFVNWIANDVIPKLPAALGTILTAIGDWITQKVTNVIADAKALGAGFVQGIQDGIAGALGGFWSWLQSNFVDRIPDFVKRLLNIHSPSGVFAAIGRSIVDGLRVGMESRLPSIDELVSRMVGQMTSVGNLDDWLRAAIAFTGVGEHWLSGLRWLAMHESTGNPLAVNPQGVNGQHATGLMQTMPSTFAAYSLAGMKDIFNPVHNAVAAIRYIQRTYGSIDRVINGWAERGGYAEGGIAWNRQLAWVGEREPEAIIPRSWFGSSGGSETIRVEIALGGRIAEEIYVTGRQLAIRRGRVTSGATL